jgi:hypothetical protein
MRTGSCGQLIQRIVASELEVLPGARASWILESELDVPANVERAQPRE